MAELLNEVISAGGTTALTEAVTRNDIAIRMSGGQSAIWHVAEDDTGMILGFQWVEPHKDHGPEVANIATFARIGQTGIGIGSALFDATRDAALVIGYRWINATIRADNEGGLIYYQSRGFETYGRVEGVRLASGRIVDQVLKRYDL